LIFAGRRVRGENFELIGPETRVMEAKKLLEAGTSEASAEDMEFLRITEGVPSIPGDLGPGDLPNEGGLENAAISYTKGCYLGQEIMARLKNMGQVRRRLHVIQGAGKPPAAQDTVYQGEKKIGQIRSVAAQGNGFVALAMLSLVPLAPADGLSMRPGAEPTARIISRG
jgi:folate-binding protein YgfZ